MATYRAAYYVSRNGDGTVLTRQEHAGMSDEELRSEALAEAQRGDIVDMAETDPAEAFPRLTLEQFNAGLQIGDWKE